VDSLIDIMDYLQQQYKETTGEEEEGGGKPPLPSPTNIEPPAEST